MDIFRRLLGGDLVRTRYGTHEKVLVVDVGSWNWLSNGNLGRRRELSVLLRAARRRD